VGREAEQLCEVHTVQSMVRDATKRGEKRESNPYNKK
jgi:hypothetical protein